MGARNADKVKASKLRALVRKGEKLPDDQQAWFESYEAAHSKAPTSPGVRPAMPVPGAKGRSATERITYTEERAAAEGDHVHPHAYANMVRAEGLRADTLLRIVADALQRVNDQYHRLNEHLLARLDTIETAHVDMLEAVRSSYIARTEAEAAAIVAQASADAEGDDATFMKFMQMAMEARKLREKGDAATERPRRRRRERPLGEVK